MSPKEAAAMEELGIIADSKDVFGKRAVMFNRLVDEIAAQQEIKKQAEQAIKQIQIKLETLFTDSNQKTIMSEGRRVTLVFSSNSHLDRKLLIEAGVAAETIVKCTRTTEYSFVKITVPKE